MMSKNADTITLGGSRFDFGPKVLKKTGRDKAKIDTDVFIKLATASATDIFIDGFETSLKKISFK